jgi:NADPH:quinone reductase-like Zn-dependent oxidoreductase
LQIDQQSFQQFIRDVEAGLVHLNIGMTFTLDDIVAAHRLMDSNAAGGKIVVLTEG